MKWVRTYTKDLEYTTTCGHPVIIDPKQCEPFYLEHYNYYPLFQSIDTDVAIIEWDVALSLEDRRRFEEHIEKAPGLVQVAPYRQYTGWCAAMQKDREHAYVHRVPGEDIADLSGKPSNSGHFVEEGETHCILFGFGLVYIPLWIIKSLLHDLELTEEGLRRKYGSTLGWYLGRKRVTDVSFSYWHYAALGHGVPVHWDVNPVHLHYEVD